MVFIYENKSKIYDYFCLCNMHHPIHDNLLTNFVHNSKIFIIDKMKYKICLQPKWGVTKSVHNQNEAYKNDYKTWSLIYHNLKFTFAKDYKTWT